MFQSILVPLDGSAHSERALGFATWLAQRTGAQLRICHVREVPEPAFSDFAVEDEAAILSHLEEYLGVHSRRATRQLGREVSHHLAVGAPVPALIAVAREAGADLIVLTPHGLGGPAQSWLGGTAEGLARQSGTPLLLVRPSAREEAVAPEVGRILVPLDGSTTAEAVLGAAIGLARLAGASISLLAVVELPVRLPGPPRAEPVLLSGVADPEVRREHAMEYLEGIADRLRSERLTVAVEVRDAVHPATAILQAAADLGADAIAMTTRGRSRLHRRTVGSVSDKVIRAAGMPVLLVPSREVETILPRPHTAAVAAHG